LQSAVAVPVELFHLVHQAVAVVVKSRRPF
jgi:hypothetical protein